MIDKLLQYFINHGWLGDYRDIHKVHFLLGAVCGFLAVQINVLLIPVLLFPATQECYQWLKGQPTKLTVGDLAVRYLGTLLPFLILL